MSQQQHGNLQNSYGAEAVPMSDGGLEVVQQQPQKYVEHYAPVGQAPVGQTPGYPQQGVHTPDYPQGGHTPDYSQQGQWQHPYAPPSVMPPESEKPKKRILGLSVAAFWVIVGLVILIVLGVALGAGLGVGLQKNNTQSAPAASTSSGSGTTAGSQQTTPAPSATSSSSSKSSSSSTSTTSSFVPVKTGTTGIADNSCQSTTPSTYHSKDGTKFTAYCFTDWPDGVGAADGSSAKVKDIGKTLVYTFEDCIEYCLSFNDKRSDGQTKCAAVTYNSNITSIYAHSQASCFLKDRMGKNLPGAAESACAVIAL